MNAETLIAESMRSDFDDVEIQARGCEIFGCELRLLDAILNDRGAGRGTNPRWARAFVDWNSRPCAPVLRDRAPTTSGTQVLELDDVAAMCAAGKATEAAVAMKA
jgi:hypothetical protein